MLRLRDNFNLHWEGESKQIEDVEEFEEELEELETLPAGPWGQSAENPWIFKVSKNIRSGVSELLINQIDYVKPPSPIVNEGCHEPGE